MPSSSHTAPPSSRQLHYLRALGEQTATSFAYPSTRAQASAEIDRLVKLKSSDRPLPLDAAHDSADPSPGYGPQVHEDEVRGHGASASWATMPVVSRRAPQAIVGDRTELGRYTITSGERVVYGQRVNGRVRVTDLPATAGGRSYLIETDLEIDGFAALKSLVAHYIEQAGQLDQVPMATSALRNEGEQLQRA